MKKLSKYLIALAVVSFLVVPALSFQALAQTPPPATGGDPFGINPVTTGLDGVLADGDPREMAGRIINVALGFLGLIAVVIILMGGFKWMTAGGNEDKVSEAKKLLGAGVIGLAIVLAAWAVSSFVIDAIYDATQGTT
jgi:hypothetical protein